LEEFDVPLADVSAITGESKLFEAQGIIFREDRSGQDLDFHHAPRRQLVFNLTGEFEIECGDGSKGRIGPGEILLAEDLSGQGHIFRSSGPRQMLFVALSDDFDVGSLRG
jgi:hypothetical protein